MLLKHRIAALSVGTEWEFRTRAVQIRRESLPFRVGRADQSLQFGHAFR